MSYYGDLTFLLHLFYTMLKVQTIIFGVVILIPLLIVLMDVYAASIMSSCMIHEVACLNISDHLPLSVTVNVPTDSIELANDLPARIDWTKAKIYYALCSYSRCYN